MVSIRAGKFTLLYFILLHLNTFLNAAPGQTKANLKSRLSNYPKLVVLSFDGFRYDFINKTSTPNLHRVVSEGVYTNHLRPRFPTKTFPNHQSLATGLNPESHGIVSNTKVFDELLNKEVGPGDEQFWNYRPDVAPIWTYNEWANTGRYSGSNWAGSNFPYGNNRTLPTYIFGYQSSDFIHRMDEIIDALTDSYKPANLLLMYFNEPDMPALRRLNINVLGTHLKSQAHAYGPESSQVITAIQKVDTALGYLLQRLEATGIKDEINLIVLSDHGFQEVSLTNVIPIRSLYDNSLAHTPYVNSPVFMLAPKAGKKDILYQQLRAASAGKHFKVYLKEDLPEGWHFKHNDRRVYAITLVADTGYAFDDYSYTASKKVGIHGYDNNVSTMQAFFAATGPAFKKGYYYPDRNEFTSVDVFPLMCKIINLTPPPRNNGSLGESGLGLL